MYGTLGLHRRVALAWFAAMACCLPADVLADTGYVDELLARADTLRLAQTRQWHALVHYRRNLVRPGVKGQADDAGFYLSPHGKTDPAAELESTLRAFFAPPVEETAEVQHPQCRFVARYRWLREVLGFDAARLPEQDCPRFADWRDALQASELTLVFPSAFINNPSSMFGHTLLRVDGAGQDDRTRLLAYAINYAVTPPPEDGQVTFIFKSLTGFYPGHFSISPYYVKVKEYSDMENRDIWEYRLNFTQSEIDLLLMHAWELSTTHFDYYFFDENCAFHLLSLFEVARPDLDLTSRFRGWVIPIDTVRLIAAEAGLLKEAVYRPASNTRLRHRLGALDADGRATVRRLVDGEQSPDAMGFDDRTRALVLEAAFSLLRHEANKGRHPQPVAAQRSRDLLIARSALPSLDEPIEPPAPAVRPDEGHATRRFAAGVGRDAGRDYIGLALRPAYNDLLDPPGGYTEGAQINFLDVGLRHYTGAAPTGGRTQLERLAFIDVFSLTPRDEFFRPVSWRLGTGLARREMANGRRELVWRNHAGGGFAWGRWEAVMAYAMAEATFDLADRLDENYAVGAGPHAGVFLRPLPNWKVNLYGRLQEFRLGERHREREYGLEQSVSFGIAHAVRIQLAERRERGRDRTTAGVSWHWYF